MELAQLGAIKILLLEVLASASSTSAAATNAQIAAKAATAAMEAVVTLRATMDSALEAHHWRCSGSGSSSECCS